MTMRHALLILTIATAGVVGFRLFLRGGLERIKADRIISKIGEYRRLEGHLPDPANHALMQTLGFELRAGWHPDYEPLDATNYRITILEGMDGPYWFYESQSHEWHHGYPTKTSKAEPKECRQGLFVESADAPATIPDLHQLFGVSGVSTKVAAGDGWELDRDRWYCIFAGETMAFYEHRL